MTPRVESPSGSKAMLATFFHPRWLLRSPGFANDEFPKEEFPMNDKCSVTTDQTFVLRHLSFVITILCSLVLGVSSLLAAPKEFRGVWVATVYNLDWPSKPG